VTAEAATPTAVLTALASGDYESIHAHMPAQIVAAIPADMMKAVWTAAQKEWGRFVGVDGPPVVLHELPLKFKSASAHFQVAYRGEEIVGLILKPGPPSGRFGQ
jgi:putative heme iron utilization protein